MLLVRPVFLKTRHVCLTSYSHILFACLAIFPIPSCHWIWKTEWQAKSRRLIRVLYISQVSLEDLYNGATRQLALQKSILCPKCDGIGGKKVCCLCCLCNLWPFEAFFFYMYWFNFIQGCWLIDLIHFSEGPVISGRLPTGNLLILH